MKDYFDFQRFRVRHDRCAMKVGTDGVLLGAWAEVEGASVLDVGCGSGLISLMAAQRGAKTVTGVEIDAEAATQASENIAASPWSDRITIRQGDILKLAPSCDLESTEQTLLGGLESAAPYDAIVSNPPYFVETTTPPNSRRALARHATAGTLTYSDLISVSHRLLRAGSSLQVVLPYSAISTFHAQCALVGFSLLRRTDVLTKEGQTPRRTLLHFIKDGSNATLLPPPHHDCLTLLDTNGQRTAAYTNLTKDFYLEYRQRVEPSDK